MSFLRDAADPLHLAGLINHDLLSDYPLVCKPAEHVMLSFESFDWRLAWNYPCRHEPHFPQTKT